MCNPTCFSVAFPQQHSGWDFAFGPYCKFYLGRPRTWRVAGNSDKRFTEDHLANVRGQGSGVANEMIFSCGGESSGVTNSKFCSTKWMPCSYFHRNTFPQDTNLLTMTHNCIIHNANILVAEEKNARLTARPAYLATNNPYVE